MLRRSSPEHRKRAPNTTRWTISQHNVPGHIMLPLRRAPRARGSACGRRPGGTPGPFSAREACRRYLPTAERHYPSPLFHMQTVA